ncbi:hypothetical protein Ancab_035565 [Ancistrocladus abbreviatus]
MTHFSGTAIAGRSYMEVVKSHILVVKDKLWKGQEGLDREKASRSVDGKQMLPSSLVERCLLDGFRCSGCGASLHMAGGIKVKENSKSPKNNDDRSRNSIGFEQNHRVQDVRPKGNVSLSVEHIREGYMSSSRERSTKDIKGDETKVIMMIEEEGCAAHSARTKSLDLRQKTDSNLGNSNAAGPLVFQSKKELVYKDQSLCMAWATDLVTVGCSPDHSECNRPLSRCPVKLKFKRASISHKQKKSK